MIFGRRRRLFKSEPRNGKPTRSAGLFLGLWLVLLPLEGLANENRQLEPLWRSLKLGDFVGIIAAEGRAEAPGLDATLLGGAGGAAWKQRMEQVYSEERMVAGFRAALSRELARVEVGAAIEFYNTPLGQKAVGLELSAREAMLDPAIEEASVRRVREMARDRDPRLEQVRDFVEANDLVDNNVVGTMNGNYAFLATLADEGLGPFAEDPAGILAEIWGQEEELRQETEEWALAYFNLAYDPLDDAEIETLTAFSLSEGGRRLNRVLFAAFDDVFTQIAVDIARVAADLMKGERL